MKTSTTKALMFITAIGLCLCAGLGAADAAKQPAPSPTLESVSKERDDLKAENAELKKQVATLTTQVSQLQAAAQELVNQRDQILQNQINAAVAKAAQPQK